ncbi:MAG: prepilin-type N-terminal cleavage/methylation domain-containing protein [Opitutaceae bacterium]|nr:prepilin-type N-terminal cleavage/methylation domain-containing protein [Opitutaceae bacterium]
MKKVEKRKGFTLIEILLAVTIGAWVIVAATTFVFSMGELWGRGGEDRLFDRHVRGVSRFLEGAFREAANGMQASSGQGEASGPVSWQIPAGTKFGKDELLTFELAESPGLLVWPNDPLPFVVCSLRLDPSEGLFLLWKSRLEIDFDEAAPRETRISPFVQEMTYFYYEDEGDSPVWEENEEPLTDIQRQPLLPDRVRLTFVYDGLTRTEDLVLPQLVSGAPLY